MESKNIITALSSIAEAINNGGGSSDSGSSSSDNSLIKIVFNTSMIDANGVISFEVDVQSSSTTQLTQLVRFHKEGLPIIFIFNRDSRGPYETTLKRNVFLDYEYYENSSAVRFQFSKVVDMYPAEASPSGSRQGSILKIIIANDEETDKMIATGEKQVVYFPTQSNS